jgi:GDPmannose 4,6-dehydratase
MTKVALITGITGQDGSYLAELLLAKGYIVHGIKRRSSSFNTGRVNHLYDNPRLTLHFGDVTDATNIIRLLSDIQPNEIYHLAAQSHVHVSFETPEYTANSDALGTLRILEGIRILKMEDHVRFYQASTSELYGKVQDIPQTEKTPFYPRSPYAVAKLYAHWIVVNYREAYGIHASNGILFNHECCVFDTPVVYKRNGLIDIKPIGELVTHRADPSKGKKYQTAPEGLEIWDGENWSQVTLATATWRPRGEANIIEVNCRGAYYQTTGDHVSFLNGDIEAKTSDLKPGQALALKTLPPLGNAQTSVSLEEAELLGMLTADGYLNDERGKGTFTKNDDALRERVSTLWRQVAGGYTTGSSYDSAKTVKKINLNGNPAVLTYWRAEMYTERKFKRVPTRILNASEQVRETFLRGYNACDGLKGGHDINQELKAFTTNSAVLAQGLYLLCSQLGYRITLHPGTRGEFLYYHLNINVKDAVKGQHLMRPLNEIKVVSPVAYEGWVFDLATKSGTFSAGIGLGWVHNSPRRGETFVTRKITRAVAAIYKGEQECLYLGNLSAMRDWGHAQDYVEAMWLMMQQSRADDYVIATGESHSVREFVELAFAAVGITIWWVNPGSAEDQGICMKTKKTLVRVDTRYIRPTEVQMLLGDPTKAHDRLGWKHKISFKELVREMVASDLEAAS